MNSYIFFRNDDVRGELDKSLINITENFINYDIPISHTVEPANVTPQVIHWLIEIKKNYPHLVEITQHGYSHKLNYEKLIGGKIKKGEFGGNRTYEEQYQEIKKGKDLMEQYFGDYWFPLFVFPFGGKNYATIQAINDVGFKVINGSMGISKQAILFYFFGRLLNREMLFGRKISYNLRHKKGTNLFQIDTSFDIIKKYLNEQDGAVFYSIDELKIKTIQYFKKSPTVGIVLHHRYHNTQNKIKLLEEFIAWLKTLSNVEFVTQEFIYNKYAKY